MSEEGLIGVTARVTHRVTNSSVGEVVVSLPGKGNETYLAYANDQGTEFEIGARVTIIDESGRTVYIV